MKGQPNEGRLSGKVVAVMRTGPSIYGEFVGIEIDRDNSPMYANYDYPVVMLPAVTLALLGSPENIIEAVF